MEKNIRQKKGVFLICYKITHLEETMKKLIFIVATLVAFVANASAVVNKSTVFGLMYTDGVEFSTGKDAPDFTDEAGYRSHVALTFDMMFAITPSLAIHPALGFVLRAFSFEGKDYSEDYSSTDVAMGIELPIMARCYFTEGFFGEFGPVFDFSLFEKYYNDRTDEWTDIETNENVYAGITAGLGYTFRIGLELGSNFTYGLTNLYEHADWKGPRFNLNIAYWFNYR